MPRRPHSRQTKRGIVVPHERDACLFEPIGRRVDLLALSSPAPSAIPRVGPAVPSTSTRPGTHRKCRASLRSGQGAGIRSDRISHHDAYLSAWELVENAAPCIQKRNATVNWFTFTRQNLCYLGITGDFTGPVTGAAGTRDFEPDGVVFWAKHRANRLSNLSPRPGGSLESRIPMHSGNHFALPRQRLETVAAQHPDIDHQWS